MRKEDIKTIVDLNFSFFGEEIGSAMSIYQAVVISSLMTGVWNKMKCEVCNYNDATNILEFEDGKISVCNECLEVYFVGEEIEWQYLGRCKIKW
jgi:hypothetical protein